MWRFVVALCVLRLTTRGCAHGTCARKESPPGVVVLPQGSDLLLSCSGRLIGGKEMFSSAAVTLSAVSSTTHNALLPSDRETHPTRSSSNASVTIWTKTPPSAGDVHEFEDDEEEKDGGAAGVTWKWNGRDLRSTRGSTLSLPLLRTSHSGRYSCHLRGTERSSTRVIVAEAAEVPHLSCHKKSPSSKIRCEWNPRGHAERGTSCSLLLRKRLKGSFLRVPCSYSTQRSKCWCTVDHNEEDKRTLHQAFLCVSSVSSNASSALVSFTPMSILKPDPPHNVSVRPETGRNRSLVVTWRSPRTWRIRDRFYELVYQLRYKPLSSAHFQTVAVAEHVTRHTITDAAAGDTYEVQVRTRDEYEGQWSDWTEPQRGRSWTVLGEEHLVTAFPYLYSDGSGSGDYPEDPSSSTRPERAVLHHFLWILAASLGVCVALLVVCIIRSKAQWVCASSRCSDAVHPRPRPSADAQDLLRHVRPHKDAKEERQDDQTKAINFNNTSYFLSEREL